MWNVLTNPKGENIRARSQTQCAARTSYCTSKGLLMSILMVHRVLEKDVLRAPQIAVLDLVRTPDIPCSFKKEPAALG